MSDDVTLTSELEDTEESPGYDWSRLDLTRLWGPNALRRMAGIVVALLIMFWPERSDLVLGRLIGIALVFYALTALWSLLSVRPVQWLDVATALGAIGLGGFLVVAPAETETALGRLAGALLVAKGAWDLLSTRLRSREELGWRITSALSTIAVGLFMVAFPSQLLSVLTFTLAAVWVVVELIAISVILDPDRDADAPRTSTAVLIRRWFDDRPKAVDDRQRLYAELLYEGDRAQAKITRFAMLMIFASVIASMGVVSDSTAVVVGAMLIAPLMTPLMAMALSLVMGWPNRLARSALVALVGILLAIAIGFVIGLADFTLVDTLTNGQIVSRSNPTIVDLVIAVAAGAAGAYGLSRPDVSNSLPGVAIAIALVPPLTVVGIAYSQGDADSGNGALLLFLTNAIAILVVGGVMFLLLGVAPLSRAAENQHRVRTALAAIAGAAVLVIGALLLNGTSVASNVFEQRTVQKAVNEWIEPFPDHTTVATDVVGDTVSVVIAGPVLEESPSADTLADELTAQLGRDIAVDLRVRVEVRETSG